VLMLGATGSAVAAAEWAPGLGLPALIGWVALLAFIYARIEYHWRRRASAEQ
jgi:hypothetical protein